MLGPGGIGHFIKSKLKGYLLAGLLVAGPIGLTVVVIQWIVGLMDGLLLAVLPERYQPNNLFGFGLPGGGLVATVLVLILVGFLATNIFGRSLVRAMDNLVGRIPLVKGVYTLFKQVADTLFVGDRQGFRKVVLIEYPRKGIWTIAFMTGLSSGELPRQIGRRVINVFVPTTPNPTSGFYLLVPEEDAKVLEMSVEDAFKLIVSGGMVTPPDKPVKVTGNGELKAVPSDDGAETI